MDKIVATMVCFLFLIIANVGFAKDKNIISPSKSAYQHASDNAKFKRTKDLFNSKASKELRAKKLAKAIKLKKIKIKEKIEEDQSKGEGQVKVKF